MSGKKECTRFEDETVKLAPGMVPDTYTFNCPGNMCKPDNNNNKPVEAPAQPIRQIPKMQNYKCPPQEPKQEQCKEPPKKQVEDAPPTKCSVPVTQNFKCPPKEEDNANKSEVISGTCGSSLSAGLSKPNCKCGTRPIPTVKPCGCPNKSGANCGPNTSCEVQPLTMGKNQ